MQHNILSKMKHLFRMFLALSPALRIGVILLVIAIGSFIVGSLGKSDEVSTNEYSSMRVVATAKVGELSQDISPITLQGTVSSVSEATIRAEGGGRILGVYKKLGDYVSAGQIIAEFENSAERAGVLSAEGAYEAATAGKAVANISLDSSDNSVMEAKKSALNVLAVAYAGLDDAVRTKTDPAWANPQTREAKLRVTVPDAKLVIVLESLRTEIEKMLVLREAKNRTLTTESDLEGELNLMEQEANMVKSYLDDLSLAFNRALPDNNASVQTIEGYKASTAIARSSVGGLLSSITGARSALSGSISGNLIAEQNSGGGSSDAQIKLALGNLRGAQARLEKTIVRSPIAGTINSLSIHTGDYVSPYSPLAVVANNGSLEVIAYATEEERAELAIGAKVIIDGKFSGVLTRGANALDPRTKKLELRIAIVSRGSGLINGQSVEVSIDRLPKNEGAGDLSITIPLSALKLTPSGANVFTVNTEGVLVAHKVSVGTLQGTKIAITEGLTPDMDIVVDARGLKEGMVVTVK